MKNQTLARPRHFIKSSRSARKPTAFATYTGAFLFIVTIVAIGYQPPQQSPTDSVVNAATPQSLSQASSDASAASVDELIATRVAAAIAERTELPIARNVAQLSTSLSIESELAQTENNVVSKPQIIALADNSYEIKTYQSVTGDTVSKVAAQFSLSPETVKWANNLTTDILEPGKSLQILPVNGILYTVKDGDTIIGVSQKYQVDKDIMVKINNLEEKTGLSTGSKLILQNGQLPDTERPGYVVPRQQQTSISYGPIRYGAGFGGTRTWTIGFGTASNKYAYGNCTAYAFNRRVQLGKPVGNFWGHAATWDRSARAEGYLVNNEPSVGAIMQNGGGYGHVAIVEAILENGDLSISEMNAYVPGGGFNIVSGRIVPAGNVGSYTYIH